MAFNFSDIIKWKLATKADVASGGGVADGTHGDVTVSGGNFTVSSTAPAIAGKANALHTHALSDLGMTPANLADGVSAIMLATGSGGTVLGCVVGAHGTGYTALGVSGTGAPTDRLFASYSRLFGQSDTTPGRIGGLAITDSRYSFRNNSAGYETPRRVRVVFGIGDSMTGVRNAFGVTDFDYVTNVTNGLSQGIEPSASVHGFFGFIADSTHTNLHSWQYRAGVGAGTLISLGAGFPVTGNSVFQLDMECTPGPTSAQITWVLTNLVTGAIANGIWTDAGGSIGAGSPTGWYAIRGNGANAVNAKPYIAAYVTDGFLGKVMGGPVTASPVKRTVTSSTSALSSDDGGLITYNSAVDGTITIPTILTAGWQDLSTINVYMKSTGVPSFQAAAGVTLNIPVGTPAPVQGNIMSAIMVESNVWAVR